MSLLFQTSLCFTMSGLKDMYLVTYNVLCCIGWAFVWVLAVQSLSINLSTNSMSVREALANVYEPVQQVLFYSQCAALLEIVHAALRLVRSPVLVTAMQVMSRIVALFALVNSTRAQSTFQHNDVARWQFFSS